MHNTAKAIEELRQSGFRVKIQHRRPLLGAEHIKVTKWELDEYNDGDGLTGMAWAIFSLYMGDIFSIYGGETIVKIIIINDEELQIEYTGISECSKKDRFNRKLGLQIALGRALKKVKNGESD
jgi:hypothetical protein